MIYKELFAFYFRVLIVSLLFFMQYLHAKICTMLTCKNYHNLLLLKIYSKKFLKNHFGAWFERSSQDMFLRCLFINNYKKPFSKSFQMPPKISFIESYPPLFFRLF